MGFQYRKSIKVMPGVRMTVSKSGISASGGVTGARMTKSTSGRTTKTVGIPGSGIRHTTSTSSRSRSAAQPQAPSSTKNPAPGMFSPKGERALYKAIQINDLAAIEAVIQEYPDYALVAATSAVMAYTAGGNADRVNELLTWVFNTGRDPTDHEFFRKYLSGSLTLEIAAGITAELPIDRQALGLLLAEVRQERSDIDGAINVVEQLEPTALAAVSLAELYTVAGRYEDAVDLTDGLANADDATAILLVFRGHSLRMLGHFTAARETLRDALRSSKRDSAILQRALVERAYAYLAEGRNAQARKDAERLMAQDRSHPLLPALLAAIDHEVAWPRSSTPSRATSDDAEPTRLPPPSVSPDVPDPPRIESPHVVGFVRSTVG